VIQYFSLDETLVYIIITSLSYRVVNLQTIFPVKHNSLLAAGTNKQADSTVTQQPKVKRNITKTHYSHFI